MTLNPRNVNFRPMTEADLPLMHKWLNTDFVMEYYVDEPVEMAEIEQKYLPRIRGEVPTYPYIIFYETTPIGYIQTYRQDSWPDYGDLVGIPDSAGVDLFIGEVDYIHKGLGSHILRRFIRDIVFPKLDVSICVIGPAENNTSAIRSYEKAGFRYVKTITVPDEEVAEYIMAISRDELFSSEIIRVRTSVVIIEHMRILLVPEFYPDKPTKWVLPGGVVEFGEALRAAAVRETREETGLEIECGERLDVFEVIEPDIPWHSIAVIFAGHIIGGELKAEVHPKFGKNEPRWFTVAELQSVKYHPLTVIDKVMGITRNGTF